MAFHSDAGLTNREIAERLFITEQTVKNHLCDVFEKLNVHRRSELWRWSWG
ncbi:MAG: response regulator transcription factor [Nitrospirae bacterium]|nr:MAG: response regulator transcription factor [Nitrospirota bacterium]